MGEFGMVGSVHQMAYRIGLAGKPGGSYEGKETKENYQSVERGKKACIYV